MSLKIKRPEKIVNLCLDADLQADWEAAEASLDEAKRGVQDERMAAKSSITELAEQVREIEDKMLSSTAKFRLRGMQRSEWARHVAENGPRDGDREDQASGFNRETFFDAVISASIVEVTRDGEKVDFDPAEEWTPLADEMTDQQFAAFSEAVWALNRGEVAAPFSRSASRALRSSSVN